MKQTEALDILKMGHNVFLTGPPGAGKTFVLNSYIEYLKQHQIPVGITASTGIAATHIGGMTIHSWSGIGIREELSGETLEKLATKAPLVKRISNAKVLIIDEVSMLHGKRLDLVNQICKYIKKSERPFGGIQVVLTGDLFQLPPVTKNRGNAAVDFVFKSAAWKELRLKVCYISEQHRQHDDDLLNILHKIRQNEAGYEEIDTLQTRQSDELETSATRLYTHNADVDAINQHRLEELSEDLVEFSAATKGGKVAVESLTGSCLAPELLQLKTGAEIMTVTNDQQQRFVNGSRGVVIGFDEETGSPIIKLHSNNRVINLEIYTWVMGEGDKVMAEFAQYPLRLAWAITIHKSQGMSLDEAEIDLGRSFEPGMGYVALSRVRSLDGIILRGINDMALMVHPEILDYDQSLQTQSVAAQNALQSMKSESIEGNHDRMRQSFAPKELEFDKDLFANLKKWRTTQAKKNGLPPYMIFDDKTLKQISATLPASIEDLLSTKGVGPKKADKYGPDILAIISSYVRK